MDEVKVGKIYKHYKGGRYLVIALSIESTNARVGTPGVIYISLTHGKIKHRDLSEFVEIIEWPDGVKRARFIPEENV